MGEIECLVMLNTHQTQLIIIHQVCVEHLLRKTRWSSNSENRPALVQALPPPLWIKFSNSLGFNFLLHKIEVALVPHRVAAGTETDGVCEALNRHVAFSKCSIVDEVCPYSGVD